MLKETFDSGLGEPFSAAKVAYEFEIPMDDSLLGSVA